MFHVDVITPEAKIFSADADSVSLPTIMGEITILQHHVPLVTTLAPGMLTVRRGKEENYFALSRGVVEIEGNTIRVLSDIADRVDTIDEQAVVEAKKRAENLLKEKRTDTEAFTEASALLDREIARLRAVRRRRSEGRRIPRSS